MTMIIIKFFLRITMISLDMFLYEESGMTQSELANKIGTDKSYISRVERGQVKNKNLP
ncbi:MAG: helix-turn-helix transcriptional regulator [Muribaculaceae bacterium]|nr:helix-turn-helix transcriptional regulator [Muribaculaceae bacterium]